MRVKITKETLVKSFLSLESTATKECDKLITRIETFASTKPDTELTLIVNLLKATRADNKLLKFEDCCAIAAPVFEILDNTTHWGYIECYVLTIAIGYCYDFDRTYALFQEAIDVLDSDDYVNDSRYKSLRTNLHINLTLRIARARYYDLTLKYDRLQGLFKQSYDYMMETFKRKNLPQQYVLEARRGIFENNMKLVEAALNKLAEIKERKWYRVTKDEIMESLLIMGDVEISKPLSRLLIGFQIRKRRNELGITVEGLADMTGFEETTITAIERAAEGVSLQRLNKIARALQVDISYFCGDESGIRARKTDKFIQSMETLMHDATDEDRNFIYSMAKSYIGAKKA